MGIFYPAEVYNLDTYCSELWDYIITLDVTSVLLDSVKISQKYKQVTCVDSYYHYYYRDYDIKNRVCYC